MWCEEYCIGCKCVICYECNPRTERYCQVNLGSNMIDIRDYLDKRCNTMIYVDKIDKQASDFCKSCAFTKLKNGSCMIKVKKWEERKVNQHLFH